MGRLKSGGSGCDGCRGGRAVELNLCVVNVKEGLV